MTQETLFAAVRSLADSTQAFTDVDMAQPFHWHQHREGVRLGLIGTYHELRDLAATLTNRRVQAGPATSLAQQVLGQVHMGYRELQAVLLGVTAEMFEKEPATAEWPLRITLGRYSDDEQCDFIADRVAAAVARVRGQAHAVRVAGGR